MQAILLPGRKITKKEEKNISRLPDDSSPCRLKCGTFEEADSNFRTIFDSVSDGMLVGTFDDQKFTDANRKICEMLDYTKDELLGLGLLDIIPSEHLSCVIQQNKKLFHNEIPVAHNIPLLRKDKSVCLTDLTGGSIILNGQEFLVGIFRDISKQKRAEEKLRRKEASLRYAQSQAHLGSWEINVSTQTSSWSEEMFRIFGFDSTWGVPTFEKFESIIHPDDRERVSVCFNQSVTAQKPFHDEYRIVTPDGSVRWIEGRGKPISDYMGRMIEFSGTAQDITERKQMENELIASESNFRHSLDDSPLGIRVVTLEGDTIYANKAVLNIYGYENIDEMRSAPLSKRYTPESYAEYKKRNEKRLKGEKGPSEYNVSIVTKSGEVRHLHVLRKDIVWNGKKQYQVIYQDITDRRKAEEKLSQTLDNLRQSIKATIQVLGMASEARDPYTAGHHKRVSDLARAIAIEKRMSQDVIEGIRMAGSIHDIGKLSVPGEILSKPNKLTDLEFSLIKEHSQSGYEMLKHVESPWPLAQIVQQHHERMDGTGYPLKLKGNEIIMEARIIAVADVVEAMASHRPYRPALGVGAALAEIEQNKGILYDEDVVDTCLRLFREKGYKLT